MQGGMPKPWAVATETMRSTAVRWVPGLGSPAHGQHRRFPVANRPRSFLTYAVGKEGGKNDNRQGAGLCALCLPPTVSFSSARETAARTSKMINFSQPTQCSPSHTDTEQAGPKMKSAKHCARCWHARKPQHERHAHTPLTTAHKRLCACVPRRDSTRTGPIARHEMPARTPSARKPLGVWCVCARLLPPRPSLRGQEQTNGFTKQTTMTWECIHSLSHF